jgi:hypothetical protein
MTAIARITLLSVVLGLSACAVQQPPVEQPTPSRIPPSQPSTKPAPSTVPSKPTVPAKPAKPLPRTSASFRATARGQ